MEYGNATRISISYRWALCVLIALSLFVFVWSPIIILMLSICMAANLHRGRPLDDRNNCCTVKRGAHDFRCVPRTDNDGMSGKRREMRALSSAEAHLSEC